MQQSNFKRPINFSTKELYIDVKLKACKVMDGHAVDLTGRKTFNTGFFKNSIGFGIIDISIEINASLQPLVEITFKDLYGNTAFGTQHKENLDIDTSILFDWPPPKFIFSFKGYLGREVTWLLNLKETHVNYNKSDGSYEIKCSFVPNQWGFLADIPFLYLIAAKSLREEMISTNTYSNSKTPGCSNGTDSIFSFIKTGKFVDMKTKETTNQFDTITNQINAFKTDPYNALYVSEILESNMAVNGDVNGIEVNDFIPFLVENKYAEKEKAEKIRASGEKSVMAFNMYLLIHTKQLGGVVNKDGKKKITNPKDVAKGKDLISVGASEYIPNKQGNYVIGETPMSFDEVRKAMKDTTNDNYKKLQTQKKKVINFLKSNLDAIDAEIQKRIYNSSKSQLAKLTIGNVMNQIAKDAGFILGSILDAGFRGYENNEAIRRESSDKIIGMHFPLMISPDNGNEIPAFNDSGEELDGDDKYGVKANEWAFVQKFIKAISEGVAKDLKGTSLDTQEGSLKKRISNAEILKDNPYKPYYTNIAENILIRSGLIAYYTRSSDPNLPGGYGTVWGSDSIKSVKKLAASDMENVPIGMLEKLSFDDTSLLKRFCKYWSTILTDEGRISDANGESDNGYSSVFNGPKENVSSILLDMPVVVDDTINPNILDIDKHDLSLWDYFFLFTIAKFVKDADIKRIQKNPNLYDEILKRFKSKKVKEIGVDVVTARQLFTELMRPENNINKYNGQSDQSGFVNTAYVNIDKDGVGTYTAEIVKNNGIYYSFPVEGFFDGYYFVLFTGADKIDKLNQVHSAPTDGSFDEDDAEEDRPDGIIVINGKIEEDKTPEEIKTLNKFIEKNHVVDYRRMLTHFVDENSGTVDRSQYLWTQKVETKDSTGGYPASNIAYTVLCERKGTSHDYFSLKHIVPLVFGGSLALAYELTLEEVLSGIEYVRNAVQTNPSNTPVSTDNEETQVVLTGTTQQQDESTSPPPPADGTDIVFGPFTNIGAGEKQRAALKIMCDNILSKLKTIEDNRFIEVSKVEDRANEHAKSIYKQMHIIFNQWASLGAENNFNQCNPVGKSNLAVELEQLYGACENHINRPFDKKLKDVAKDADNSSILFVYDYPLSPFRENDKVSEHVNVKNAIINIDALYEPRENSSILNIIQQICTKNNFVFVPFPGDPSSDNIDDIFSPHVVPVDNKPINYFHLIFAASPETRAKLNPQSDLLLTDYLDYQKSFVNTDAILIEYGGTDNQIFKGIDVSTDSTKPTAESILNLQRLVDKENTNHNVKMDCSMLPVMEGRSYKMNIDMLGNAQAYPLQYFFVENMPMFGGLYQTMKIKHAIKPNSMSTTMEGIRMRFSRQNGFGGIRPITLDDMAKNANSKTTYYRYDTTTSVSGVSIVNESDGTNTVIASINNTHTSMSNISKLNLLHDSVKAKFIELINFAEDNGYKVIINSTYRTFKKQAELKKQPTGVDKNGNEVFGNATPGHSAHNYGMAVDFNLYKDGKKWFKSNKKTPKSEWEATGVPNFARSLGMVWGGDFSNYSDQIHFQLFPKGITRGSQLLAKAYKQFGKDPAKIQGNKLKL